MAEILYLLLCIDFKLRTASMVTHNTTEIMLHLGQYEVPSDGQVTSNSAQTLLLGQRRLFPHLENFLDVTQHKHHHQVLLVL